MLYAGGGDGDDDEDDVADCGVRGRLTAAPAVSFTKVHCSHRGTEQLLLPLLLLLLITGRTVLVD